MNTEATPGALGSTEGLGRLPVPGIGWPAHDTDGFTALQMREYALAQVKHAVAAEREQKALYLAATREAQDYAIAYGDEVMRLRGLLARLRQWDMLDSAADGAYWKAEIDRVLRA